MINCKSNLDRNQLLSIVDQLAVEEEIRILPFMLSMEGNISAVCPCCILKKREYIKALNELKKQDPWTYLFRRIKCKDHEFEFKEKTKLPLVESGFSARPVTQKNRRYKYHRIDTPVFKDLGFKGYKFDKHVFLPLAVHRIGTRRVRIGISSPFLLDDWPLLQKASASWLFRIKEVLPIDIPDLLPIGDIGDIEFSQSISCAESHSWEKDVWISPFYQILFERANKRRFRDKNRFASSSKQS